MVYSDRSEFEGLRLLLWLFYFIRCTACIYGTQMWSRIAPKIIFFLACNGASLSDVLDLSSQEIMLLVFALNYLRLLPWGLRVLRSEEPTLVLGTSKGIVESRGRGWRPTWVSNLMMINTALNHPITAFVL